MVFGILDGMKKAWYTVCNRDAQTDQPTRAKLAEMALADIADDLERAQ